jgi:LysM repeat protein
MRRITLCLSFLILALALGTALAPSQVARAQQPAATTHTVQPGENLYRISLRYGVSVQALAQANNLSNPNLIFVGQVLNISGGTTPPATGGTPAPGTPPPATGGTYRVVAGDTLGRIARQFNITVQSLAQTNNIANVNLIFVGQVLNIPGGTPAPGGGTATPAPGGGTATPPPPLTGGGFELGGHVLNFGNLGEMRSAGMTWAKVQIRFKIGQNADISAPAINDAHINGFKILLGIVGDKNEMASMDYNEYVRLYAEFVGNVARLGPEAIEVWNEPNLDREWPAGRISGQAYTQMLRASYESIKAVNSNILVISGAPAPTGFFGGCSGAGCDDNFFLAAMRDAGAANYMDCIGAHYNEGIVGPSQRSGDPRGNSGHYSRYFGTMLDLYSNTFNRARPVCWTELGYGTPEGTGVGAPPGFDWLNNNTLQEQVQWLGEAATLSRQSGRVRLLIVWNVNFKDTAPDPSGMYAIIRPDGSCPACQSLASALR